MRPDKLYAALVDFEWSQRSVETEHMMACLRLRLYEGHPEATFSDTYCQSPELFDDRYLWGFRIASGDPHRDDLDVTFAMLRSNPKEFKVVLQFKVSCLFGPRRSIKFPQKLLYRPDTQHRLRHVNERQGEWYVGYDLIGSGIQPTSIVDGMSLNYDYVKMKRYVIGRRSGLGPNTVKEISELINIVRSTWEKPKFQKRSKVAVIRVFGA